MDDWRDYGDLPIDFGKYAVNRTLEEVWKIDPQYCIYYLRDNPEYPEYKKYIDMRYMEEVQSSVEKMEEFRIERNCVTRMLKLFEPYHFIRLEDCLGESMNIQRKQVHESSYYPSYIVQRKLYSYNGVFYDYLIRKHVYNLQDREAFDHRSEVMLETESPECLQFEKDYEIYKDKNMEVLDILPNIYRVSLLHKLYFREKIVHFSEYMLNWDNLRTVLEYVSSIHDIQEAILNPVLGIRYFSADADMVIGDTIIDFKVSKYDTVDEKMFWQLIFYGVSYYVKEKKRMRRFIMYNPLLGLEYTLVLNNLDYDKLILFFEDIVIIED